MIQCAVTKVVASLEMTDWLRFSNPTASSERFRGRLPPGGPYYHGTTTAFGLDVGSPLLPPAETGRLTEQRRQRRSKVFLTTDLDYALSYARRAAHVWGGAPLVFEVIPTGTVKQISGRPGATAYHSTGAVVERVVSRGA